MRRVFLGAKSIALESHSPSIKLTHIIQAIPFLQPANAEHFEILCNKLGICADSPRTERFTLEDFEEVAAKPRLAYDEDVKRLRQELEQHGITIASHVTDVYVNLDSRKGSYQRIVQEVADLKALLQDKVFDQDEAIEAVSDAAMRMSWSDINNHPQAIFFFLGPPATGKTYMAQLLNQGLQGFEFRSFDMTQFSSEKESFGLVGLRKGFTDACEGYLTSFVKQHPQSILVFDEIEKSHNRVQMALLRMLSEGRLRDEFTGEDIDFRKTIVVFTSNLGSALYSNRSFIKQTKQNPHQAREHLIHAIREEKKVEDGNQVTAIPPEMLSRLEQGSIILFNKLSVSGLSKIAKDKLLHEKSLFEKKLGLTVSFQNVDKLVQLLVLGYAPGFDTRALKSRLTDQVYDPITDFLITDSSLELNDVELVLAPETEEFLDNLNLETLAHQLATKHQRIYFNHRVFTANKTLTVVFENARIEKLPKGEDFKDASGIQVDLPDVSFDNIAGHDVIKGRLNEVITLIKHREQLISQKVAPPKGMLLYGVPGTGKTMLAKAFAHEANLPFIACSGNDLLNESFIRSLFARAREYSPAIIFIDEIDALPRRGTSGPHADALVNRMLVEIDGFSGGDENDIFIIAATNRKELIDPALLRSGRIDLHYEVPQLDKGARCWFIQKMLQSSMFAPSMDVEQLVLLTAGLSGADLQKINREAVIFALREGVEQITEKHLIEQINTLKYGAPLNLEDSKHRLEETAYHEAAHAVISQVLIPERRIEQITVIARSDFLGMVAYDNEQQHDYTKTFLFNLTCIALAGRAAQLKQFGNAGLDSGASGDLRQAAKYAWLAIAEWGMDDKMFNLSIPAIQKDLGADAFRHITEQQIKLWIDNATAQTKLLVNDYWEKIEAVAKQVLKDEIVSAAALKQIMESH